MKSFLNSNIFFFKNHLEFKLKPEFQTPSNKFENPINKIEIPMNKPEIPQHRNIVSVVNSDDLSGVDSSSTILNKFGIVGFLQKFFSARPSQQELINKNVLYQEVHSENPIPLKLSVIKDCIDFIERNGNNFFFFNSYLCKL